jgi:hypothetical protein
MLSQSRTGESEVSVEPEICRTISHGLHQTTQPLTVLQGTLELALLNVGTVDEYKKAIERSLEELRRVTDCFEHLRTVAHLHQQVSDVTTFAVSTTVKTVLTSLKDRSIAAGIELVFQSRIGDQQDLGEDRVRLSPSRVSSAFKMALSELLLLLESGSKVVVLIEVGALDVLIRVSAACRVQPGAQVADTFPPLMSPRQKLAQAMAASAGGELRLGPSLKGMLIRLPKVPSACSGGEIESRKDEVAHV